MKNQTAFTLLELLCCLAIAALLLCLAVPNGGKWLARIRAEMAAQDIAAAVQYARTRAYADQVRYVLTGLPGQTDWSEGMLLFKSARASSNLSAPLRQWRWKHLQVHWFGFQSRSVLTFSPQLMHAACSGHFTIESAYGISRRVILNRVGRVMLERR